ncbi:hypothetical protein B296_00011553 [Ensete ventricosum]|uniref:VQ domain-containing protein n=1 Tax=Ensete ventricosum TaxID=4639 RepID=A0A426ZPI0_ENSVE|nr:hypothetical protein B296_00011553 [Ensete ventricosum]
MYRATPPHRSPAPTTSSIPHHSMGRHTSAAATNEHGKAPPPVRIIRMPLPKPWRRPARPSPAVYHVHSSDFRQLVQMLTGVSPPLLHAPEAKRGVTTPALPLNPGPPPPELGDNLGDHNNRDPAIKAGIAATIDWNAVATSPWEHTVLPAWNASPAWTPETPAAARNPFP